MQLNSARPSSSSECGWNIPSYSCACGPSPVEPVFTNVTILIKNHSTNIEVERNPYFNERASRWWIPACKHTVYISYKCCFLITSVWARSSWMSIKASFCLSAVKLQSAVVMRQQVTQLVELVFPRMSCVCVCYCSLLLLWLICPEASDRLCLTHTHTHTCMDTQPVSIQPSGPLSWIMEAAESAPESTAQTTTVGGPDCVSFNCRWKFLRNGRQVVWIVQN